MSATLTITKWVNVYANGDIGKPRDTEEEALKQKSKANNAKIATVPVTITVPFA